MVLKEVVNFYEGINFYEKKCSFHLFNFQEVIITCQEK